MGADFMENYAFTDIGLTGSKALAGEAVKQATPRPHRLRLLPPQRVRDDRVEQESAPIAAQEKIA
jgi:hypothetical protein